MRGLQTFFAIEKTKPCDILGVGKDLHCIPGGIEICDTRRKCNP